MQMVRIRMRLAGQDLAHNEKIIERNPAHGIDPLDLDT